MLILESMPGFGPMLRWRRMRLRASPLAAKIIGDLETEGVSVTTVDTLFPATHDVAEGMSAIRDAMDMVRRHSLRTDPQMWMQGASSVDLTASFLLEKLPGIYLLGLRDSILELAETYLGAPVAYHGAVLRHSMIDGAARGTRLWHQDGEDTHVLRMVIYLNDVDLDGGPFEYIPRRCKVSYRDFSGIENRITDECMSRVVPQGQWKQVTGAAGTVVLCDTAKTFHHESFQKKNERAVIMVGYSSRTPKGRELALRHFPVESAALGLQRIVPPGRAAHVFGWRS